MKTQQKNKAVVIGAGLAGSEAAWQLACRGIEVTLFEMRPEKTTPAHKTAYFAELVCSNSLRSDDYQHNAVGLMHEEMRRAHSLIMQTADKHKVPAGGALAVDRNAFSEEITQKLQSHPLIQIVHQEALLSDFLNDEEKTPVIIATGPLTSDKMAQQMQELTQTDSLHFFDAIAPIVYTESVNLDKTWYQSRYDKGDKEDYLNCPLTKEEYDHFVHLLKTEETVPFKEWEKNTGYFEGCLPVEVLAARGPDTLAFGPMKPMGLRNPHQENTRPYAVVQLRKETKDGRLMNMVGFQTKLTYGAQKRVFTQIPGLENAVFARLGGIHRNTFLKSPVLLDNRLAFKSWPHIRLAGQVSGCEGYIESAAMGFLAGLFTAFEIKGEQAPLPPEETAIGAMLRHVTHGNVDTFQPMNINFGIFPPIVDDGKKKKKGRDKKELYAARALNALDGWFKDLSSFA